MLWSERSPPGPARAMVTAIDVVDGEIDVVSCDGEVVAISHTTVHLLVDRRIAASAHLNVTVPMEGRLESCRFSGVLSWSVISADRRCYLVGIDVVPDRANEGWRTKFH